MPIMIAESHSYRDLCQDSRNIECDKIININISCPSTSSE